MNYYPPRYPRPPADSPPPRPVRSSRRQAARNQTHSEFTFYPMVQHVYHSEFPPPPPSPSTKYSQSGRADYSRLPQPARSPARSMRNHHSNYSQDSTLSAESSNSNSDWREGRSWRERDMRPDEARTQSLRQRRLHARDNSTLSTDSEGSGVWATVTNAASYLSINVGKAWAHNVEADDGQETPVDKDSHLIRTMKAYHLAKAKTRADLPAWLFEDIERHSTSSSPARGRSSDLERVPNPVSRPRGLQRLVDADEASPQSLPPRAVPRRDYAAGHRSTDRLRALRDAHRAGRL
ncbi:hypothetical protein FISHEDRAFT_71207 [Fistulina hepatica ATCC 64428]|nr:hypothetical protein FISHEDRAFT_71207 [Fistulina hepatica ATCC 64428]